MFDSHCHLEVKDAVFCNYEASLDRRNEDEISLEEQEENVRNYLNSNETATLHCVRCTERMIDILKDVKPKYKSVMWHNFTGSAETAAILYKLGVIISIGPRFNGNLQAVCKANPLFVLETDYTGISEEEHNKILEDHYRNCASKLGMKVEKLEAICNENGILFKNKSSTGRR